MKYPTKVEEEVLLQNSIKLEKEKLMNNVSLYRKYLAKQTDISYSIEEADKLYGTIIGLLFKNFYGCNSTTLKANLKRNHNVKIPENNIIYIMNTTHLNYYLLMLQSINKFLDKNPDTSIENIIKITTTISTVAQDHFYEENDNTKGVMPFNHLVSVAKSEMKKSYSNKFDSPYEQTTLEGFVKKR